MCVTSECEAIACVIEDLRSREPQLVQRHADASDDDAQRAELEAQMKAVANEMEHAQRHHDALETLLRSCKAQLLEARRASME